MNIMGLFTKACLKRKPRIVVRRSEDNQFYFVLVAGNGEGMFASETYTRKLDAQRAAERLRVLVAEARVVDETTE